MILLLCALFILVQLYHWYSGRAGFAALPLAMMMMMVMMTTTVDAHQKYMQLALKLARYALDHGETPVACIVVHSPTDRVVSYGMNNTNNSLTGIAHAEFMAIDTLQKYYAADGTNTGSLYRDLVLYVTVEPCIMCASALKQLGIGKVVFGCGNERFGGNGTVLAINQDHSTTPATNSYLAIPGIYRKEAIFLLRMFYNQQNERAPIPNTSRKKSKKKAQDGDDDDDDDGFPPMVWSNYIDKNAFIQEFGLRCIDCYNANTDLPFGQQSVHWDLLLTDNTNDMSILQDLIHQCDESHRFITNKRIK